MRWVIAIVAELLTAWRWPIKMLLLLVFLIWSAWSGIAGPVLEYYELLGESYGLDEGRALQG